MKSKIIKTKEDYNKAIAYLEELGDRENLYDHPELAEEFELVATLIELYEKQHFPIQHGDPIEVIKLKMNYMGLDRKDLTHIASSGVLSEVFNKKRALSKKMIRQFSELLQVDQAVLNISSELKENAAATKVAAVCEKTPPIKPLKKSPFAFIGNEAKKVSVFRKKTQGQGSLFQITPMFAYT